MKQLLLFCATCLLLLPACKKWPPPSRNNIAITITDLKGQVLEEVNSGQTIRLVAEEFSRLSQSGISPNEAQLQFNGIPVPIVGSGDNFIVVNMPVLYLADYVNFTISLRWRNQLYNLINRILYRPTVTGEVFAGYGTTAPDGTFDYPAEMALDGYGNLFVIDQRNSGHDAIIRITPDGVASVFAGGAGEFGRLVGIGIDVVTLRLSVADATAQQVKGINLVGPPVITVRAGSGTEGDTDGPALSATLRFGNDRVDNFSTNEKGQGLSVNLLSEVFMGQRYGTNSLHSVVRKAFGNVTTVPNSRLTHTAGMDSLLPIAGLTQNAATGEIMYVGGGSGFYQGLTKVQLSGPPVKFAGNISFESLNDGTGSAARFSYPKAINYYNGLYYVADGTNGALRRVDAAANVITLAGVGHFNTPTFKPSSVGPKDSSYVMPSIFNTSPDRFEDAAKAIVMDQVGGIAVRNNNLMYLSDYGRNFRCIWKIRIE